MKLYRIYRACALYVVLYTIRITLLARLCKHTPTKASQCRSCLTAISDVVILITNSTFTTSNDDNEKQNIDNYGYSDRELF